MRFIVIAAGLVVLATAGRAVAAPPEIASPDFGPVTLYAPSGPSKGLVLFLSGDGGWNLGVVDMAGILVKQGMTVAGLSVPAYLKSAEASRARCIDAASDLQAVARLVASKAKLPAGAPIVAGYSSGATIAYAAMVQGGPRAFRGGLSLGFGPDQAGVKPWCRGAGLTATPITKPERGWLFAPVKHLGSPWLVLQGLRDEVVDPAAARRFTGAIDDAQLVELPAVGHGFAVQKNWVPQFEAAFSALLR